MLHQSPPSAYSTNNPDYSSESEEYVEPSYKAIMSKFRSPNRRAPAVYPFAEPLKFQFSHHIQRFDSISDRPQEFRYQLFPHKETLEQLEIEENVRSILTNSGLSFLYLEDQGTFPMASIEFFSSFDPIETSSEYGFDIEMWRFSLAKADWKISGNQLREWFQFPSREKSLQLSQCSYNLQKTWQALTMSEDFFPGRDLSAKIKFPVWRMIHRILANTIFMRSDFGANVTLADLRVLALMATKEKIDWLDVVTQTFLEFQKSPVTSQVFGGGSFVTHILRMLNISIEGADVTKKSLDLGRLVAMRVIDESGVWVN